MLRNSIIVVHKNVYIQLYKKEKELRKRRKKMNEWELKVQAFHSSVFIAMCNRVGTEGDMDFSGESIVVDPNGDTVIKADDTEQLVYADIDLSKATNIRRHRPYTTLRRPELYK